MELKLNIPGATVRKAFCIVLVLLISLNFLVGTALASDCRGGAGCLICAASMRPGLPEMDMASDGCPPAAQNSSCGFEVSPGPDKFLVFIPAGVPDNNELGGIISNVSTDGPLDGAGEFLAPTVVSAAGRSTSIYLINNSLLC